MAQFRACFPLTKDSPLYLVLLNSSVAIAYLIAVRISLRFIVMPGEVSAVWLPSALTLALVLWCRARVFPGIVVASLIGLIDLYSQVETWWGFALVQSACAVANCLQPYAAVTFLSRQGAVPRQIRAIFTQTRCTRLFVLAAIVSPMLSACLGVTASAIVGLLPWQDYAASWITWWLASALAHLIFTPPILLMRFSPSAVSTYPGQKWEALGIVIILFLLLWSVFYGQQPFAYMLLPILIWIVFRFGIFKSSLTVVIVTTIALASTARGLGPWAQYSPAISLILLQSFIGTLSSACLILAAVTEERNLAQAQLEETLAGLEQQVKNRTAELAYSEAQLNGFFSAASMGMGIVNQDLRYVRINEQLAHIHGKLAEDHPGKTIAEIIPHIAEDLEPILLKVMKTGYPQLHHEITSAMPHHPNTEATYLASYFPIFDERNHASLVGLVVNDITTIKQLEQQLKEAALIDGLTQVANRRHFDEVLQNEWHQSLEMKQALTVFLCDVDYFKLYNDAYGHIQGDHCLTQIAQAIHQASNCHEADPQASQNLVARYGGEEFAVILPNTSAEKALAVAQHIRDRIHQLALPHIKGLRGQVTLSIGGMTCVPQRRDGFIALLHQADQSLYEAKRQGRDRAILNTVTLQKL